MTPQMLMDGGAGGVQWQPHHPIGKVGNGEAQRDGAGNCADDNRVTLCCTDFRGGGWGQADHGRSRRAREVGFAVLQPTAVEQHPPSGDDRLACNRFW